MQAKHNLDALALIMPNHGAAILTSIGCQRQKLGDKLRS